MNIIFLDIDGVLSTYHYYSNEDIKRRVKILSDICREYNCKVVIESSHKDAIDELTLKTDIMWLKELLLLFKKYNIECIGRTPTVEKRYSSTSYLPIWKEDEIRLYLYRHPEIKHYCVIDDDDMYPRNSDLNKVRNHLVTTINYSNNPDEEGLLECHKEQVGKILEKDNEIRNLIYKKRK